MLTTIRRTVELKKLRGCLCQCHAAAAAREVLGREFKLLLSKRPSKRILVLESLITKDELAGPWDYIFSAGLFATLSDSQAEELLWYAVHSLAPGGVLLIANPKFKAEACSTCAGRAHTARDEHELATLTRSIPNSLLAGQVVFEDESAANVYLEVSAAPSKVCCESVGVVSATVQ